MMQVLPLRSTRDREAPHTRSDCNSGCLIEEARCSTRELLSLLASAQMQLKAGLHGQFIDLSRTCAGQPQRYFNSSINLIIYGLADSSLN